ncbi:MAG: radical SAM family heme chaperone HemW [Clostridia bacterium]|nr:radical SAM family heme chaperone HemW [Clostridia bacterium]
MSAGLYIHIPFCVSKCIYCNFNSGVCDDYTPYLDCLCNELIMRSVRKGSTVHKSIDTIYFGGGTPSLLSSGQFDRIMDTICAHYDVSCNTEISMEINPNSASQDKIEHFAMRGVNRFSVGLQCADDKILRLLNRPHNTNDFVNTIKMIKQSGVNNISADLMLGLPKQTSEHVKTSIELCMSYNLPHISIYMLKVERGTPLYKLSKTFNMPTDDDSVDLYEQALALLSTYGLHRYEISNTAKQGYECRHNIKYWDYSNYIAVGVSASGFEQRLRYTNLSNVIKYQQKISQCKLPISYAKRIKTDEQYLEYVMLALRMDRGLDKNTFFDTFGVTYDSVYGARTTLLCRQGLVTQNANIVRVTRPTCLNSILVSLLC